VNVAADGSVADAVVERSEPKGVFDANALQAVKGWKFNPAIKDGKAVAAQVRVPVDFRPDPKVGEEAQPMKMPAGEASNPADYDWIRHDPATMGALREMSCDVIKLDQDTGVSYCGIRKQ
jgi:TonB family protein